MDTVLVKWWRNKIPRENATRFSEAQCQIVEFRHYTQFVRPQLFSHVTHYPIKGKWNYDVDLNELSFPSYSFLSCIRYLAEKFITFHLTNSSHQLLTITYGDTIKPTEQKLFTNRRMRCCISEEADARLVWHAVCCVETGCDPVVVRTFDTDVLVLMISHSPFTNEINNITRVFATMSSNS